MKLSDFLQDQFLKWMAKQGRVKSQNEFARWLGVSAGSLSQWMNGSRLPAGENVHTLAEKLGPQIYDYVGEPRAMPRDKMLMFIAENWHKLNDDQRLAIREKASEMLDQNQ